MKNALLLASAVVPAVVLAQSPLVPSSISQGCSSYLTQLNNDQGIASCLATYTAATSAFSPTANTTAKASDVSPALDKLCASNVCQDSTIRSAVSSIYAACNAELVTNVNADVQLIYDSFFTLPGLKAALCTKSNNTYCVTTLGGSGSPSSRRDLVADSGLEKRADDQVVLKPNAATYRAGNIAFLGLQPTDPSSKLCSDCSNQVQAAWIAALNAAPYAPGISTSPILAGQPQLYNATLAACGAQFFTTGGSGVNNVAGGSLSGGVLGGSDSSAAAPGACAFSASTGLLGALAIAALVL